MPRWKNTLQTADEVSRLKRRAVLREAGRTFSRRGYHNTSLDEVAKSLNVSKGTLYNYVRDKQEILYECHQMALDIGDQALEEARQKDICPDETLRAFLLGYLTALFDEFGVCGVLTETDALRPEDRKKIVTRRDRFEAEIVGMIKEGVESGSFRKVDAKLAAMNIMGAVNAIPRWFSPDGRLSNMEIAEATIDFFFGGLLARDSSG